jgi:hypothetical protein
MKAAKSIYISAMGAILFMALSFISCHSKGDDSPPDIVSWIKPCSFSTGHYSTINLTVKADQGFYLSGTWSPHYDDSISFGMVISLNPSGDTLWTSKIKIEGYNICGIGYVLEKSSNEIILLGGCRNSLNPDKRFFMWLDGSGKIKKYAFLPDLTGYMSWANKLFALSTGQIGLATYMVKTGDFTIYDYYLNYERYDEDGVRLSVNKFENIRTGADQMIQLESGEIAVVGSMYMGTPDNHDIMFLKIGQEGQEIARTHFGSDSYDVGESICRDFSDGYMASGELTYSSIPVVYRIGPDGTASDYTAVADSIKSYGAKLKKAKNGYVMFLQAYSRLYFLKMDEQLNIKYITWIDYHNYPVSFPPAYMQSQLMNDGSFAFIYLTDQGYSLIKTKPI